MARPIKKINHVSDGFDHEHMSDRYWELLDQAVAAEDTGDQEKADELYDQADDEWERFYSTSKERNGLNRLLPGSSNSLTSMTEVEWITNLAYQQAWKALSSFSGNISLHDQVKDIVSMTYESIEKAGKYDMMWPVQRRINYIKSVVESRAIDLKRKYKRDSEKFWAIDQGPKNPGDAPPSLPVQLTSMDTPEAMLEAKEAILLKLARKERPPSNRKRPKRAA